MTEGFIRIFLSYKEPEYRDNIMWLRPYIDREGYELLYYGPDGWKVFIPCHNTYIKEDNTETDIPEDNKPPLLDDNYLDNPCDCPNK